MNHQINYILDMHWSFMLLQVRFVISQVIQSEIGKCYGSLTQLFGVSLIACNILFLSQLKMSHQSYEVCTKRVVRFLVLEGDRSRDIQKSKCNIPCLISSQRIWFIFNAHHLPKCSTESLSNNDATHPDYSFHIFTILKWR